MGNLKQEISYFSEIEKEYFMREALSEARKAAELEEVPIGAVIVKDKQIIARSYNRRELDNIASHHAEINVIEEANRKVGNWRLIDCALFVTIEPCIMCAGAIDLARISQVYYGANNPKFGAVESLYNIFSDERLNHQVQVEAGLLEEECADVMQEFFRQRRNKKRP